MAVVTEINEDGDVVMGDNGMTINNEEETPSGFFGSLAESVFEVRAEQECLELLVLCTWVGGSLIVYGRCLW